MLPAQYDKNLELPLGAQVFLSIDPNQFLDNDVITLPREDWECRFYEKAEAMEVTLQIANMVGHPVELDVFSVCGRRRQLVDMVTVKPSL